MSLKQQLESDFTSQKNWGLRRQLGISNNRRLWVCACMDERLPVDKALGIRSDRGDAHVFRNAGGSLPMMPSAPPCSRAISSAPKKSSSSTTPSAA